MPTPRRHLAPLLALAALALPGCWIDACEEFDAVHGVPACREQLTGVLEDGDGPAWCQGDVSVMRTCGGLGYTAHCEGSWVRPEDAWRLTCG